MLEAGPEEVSEVLDPDGLAPPEEPPCAFEEPLPVAEPPPLPGVFEPPEFAGATPEPVSEPDEPLFPAFVLPAGFSPPAVGTCSVYWSTTEGAPAEAVPPVRSRETAIVRMAVSL